MATLINFFLSIVFAVCFLIVVEQHGYLFFQITKYLIRRFSQKLEYKIGQKLILNVFIGSTFVAMQLFFIGVLNLFKPSIILGYLAITTLIILVKRLSTIPIDTDIYSYKSKLFRYLKFNWPVALGVGLFLGIALPLSFRPPIQFDAVWYHLTIPKFFLQHGNIDYLGPHLRYSVHPYINFLWNSAFLSLPIPNYLQFISLNFFQTFLMALALAYSANVARLKFKLSNFVTVFLPILVGINLVNLWFIGSGYNDLYSFSFGLIASLFIYNLSTKDEINSLELVLSLVLICALFLLKIFFGIFAFVLLLLLLSSFRKFKLSEQKQNYPQLIRNFLIIGTSIFVLFILPWFIRSYVFTGRIMDPIGSPGLEEDVYNYAGSKTAAVHWSEFVFDRFNSSIFSILIDEYSPIVLLGVISILNKSIRSKHLNLWLTGIIGFGLTYFISIVSDFRYFLPSIAVLSFLGVLLIDKIYKSRGALLYKLVIILTPIAFLLTISHGLILVDGEFVKNQYFGRKHSIENFLKSRMESNKFTYYQSADAPVPKDLTVKEAIMTVNIHNLAYIQNPIFETRIQEKKFANMQTASDLVNVLKEQNVRFILVKHLDIKDICQNLKIPNTDSCKNENIWTVDAIDNVQGVTWIRIK